MRGYNVQLEYKSKKARLLERVLNLVCCYNMEKESSHLNRRMLTFAKKKKQIPESLIHKCTDIAIIDT